MDGFLGQLTPLNYVLVVGIVWLSGVFIWLIKVFVKSYGENTKVITKVQGTLEGVDRKLDTAADRDLHIVQTLAAIHAKQDPLVTIVEKTLDKSSERK